MEDTVKVIHQQPRMISRTPSLDSDWASPDIRSFYLETEPQEAPARSEQAGGLVAAGVGARSSDGGASLSYTSRSPLQSAVPRLSSTAALEGATVRWMWDDQAVVPQAARLNPRRWSEWGAPEDTVSALADYIGTADAERPLRIEIGRPDRDKVLGGRRFENVESAISYISKAILINPAGAQEPSSAFSMPSLKDLGMPTLRDFGVTKSPSALPTITNIAAVLDDTAERGVGAMRKAADTAARTMRTSIFGRKGSYLPSTSPMPGIPEETQSSVRTEHTFSADEAPQEARNDDKAIKRDIAELSISPPGTFVLAGDAPAATAGWQVLSSFASSSTLAYSSPGVTTVMMDETMPILEGIAQKAPVMVPRHAAASCDSSLGTVYGEHTANLAAEQCLEDEELDVTQPIRPVKKL
eukprot:TRINITY_DN7742_c0_g1_i1.p1 TRINITY_DN7742_c0_g1~~TRINITY_DN7742_c0_g1_i1.p1  ORF type:complete len:412 (+),score=62.98 TRINITY_DN7742_c0_g1_i1:205-1440(+)